MSYVFPQVTPILAVLLTVGAALLLVFVVISAYFCLTRGAAPSQRNRKANGSPGSGNNGFQVSVNLIIHDHPASQESAGNFSLKMRINVSFFSTAPPQQRPLSRQAAAPSWDSSEGSEHLCTGVTLCSFSLQHKLPMHKKKTKSELSVHRGNLFVRRSRWGQKTTRPRRCCCSSSSSSNSSLRRQPPFSSLATPL